MKARTNIAFCILSIGCLFYSSCGYGQTTDDHKRDSIQSPNSVFLKVDKSPEFPGGNDKLVHFILQNAHMPADTTDAPPVAGKVYVQFIVEKDGSLSDIKIIKSIGSRYEQECSRVFGMMPKWAPGKIGSHKVRTLMMVPITIS